MGVAPNISRVFPERNFSSKRGSVATDRGLICAEI